MESKSKNIHLPSMFTSKQLSFKIRESKRFEDAFQILDFGMETFAKSLGLSKFIFSNKNMLYGFFLADSSNATGNSSIVKQHFAHAEKQLNLFLSDKSNILVRDN